MRYTPLSKSLYEHNRQRLYSKLKPNSMVLVTSNDIMPTNGDGTMGFKQLSDLFWLTGIDQEETVVLLYPDAKENKNKEILFITETSDDIKIWEGDKLTKEQARALSGIQNIQWTSQLPSILQFLMGEVDTVYLYTNEHARRNGQVTTANQRLIQELKRDYPLHHFERLFKLTRGLRMIKHKEEIMQLQRACTLTGQAFERVCRFIAPGKMEYQVEAEALHHFVSNGSRGFSYTPIIAGGANACVLHYIENNQPLKDGDLVLMDFGCEYGNYAADLSRTVPVNGKFSARQRDVYEAVLRVQKQAIALLRPGTNWIDYHKEVGRMMEFELIALGLLDKDEVARQDPEKPLYKKYFMHGTSHHIGLDVHDVMDMYASFQPGMVFTCEPGIYIREEGIGIRIENDVLVTDGEPRDLMANIPREVEEIESLMRK